MEKPIIYQFLPRLFTNYCESPVYNGTIEENGCGKLNSITTKILKEIKGMGFTHVWYTGVLEHAHDTDYTAYGIERHNSHIVKGHAGSPYAITDYYDIDPDLAENVPERMTEFEALVDRTHKASLKLIIDFVPNHVGRQYHSDAKPAGIDDLGENDDTGMFFSPTNNFYYITRQKFSPVGVDLGQGNDEYVEFPSKASGNDRYDAFPGVNDWYDTIKLNYGVDPWNGAHHFDPVPPTWMKMLNILRYWCAKGVDGFRCDMAHMVPLEFWCWAIGHVKEKYPDVIFIAEIYDVSLYRAFIEWGRFDYLYDKVNLYDTLRGIQCDNVSAANITTCWQTVEGIGGNMLNFLENHDEVRYASVEYAGDARRVMPALVVSAMINTGPMMVYAGQELGETAAGAVGYSGDDGRTSIFDYAVIPTIQRWLNHGKCDGVLSTEQIVLRNKYVRVLRLCNAEQAISHGGFFDLMYVNYSNDGFNPHRQYAFIRHYGDEKIIIVANFDDKPVDLKINIPVHAFQALGFKPGMYRCTELFSKQSGKYTISDNTPLECNVGGNDAIALKFSTAPKTPKVKKVEKKTE